MVKDSFNVNGHNFRVVDMPERFQSSETEVLCCRYKTHESDCTIFCFLLVMVRLLVLVLEAVVSNGVVAGGSCCGWWQ
jgi:hypothetical protein